jgi:hypothetical protein
MQSGMNHHRSCQSTDSADVTFTLSILKVCSNAAKIQHLLFQLKLVSIFFRHEDSIISMVSFDSDSRIKSHLFEVTFANNSVSSAQRPLMIYEDFPASMVDKNRTTTLLIRLPLFAETVISSTFMGNNILIN